MGIDAEGHTKGTLKERPLAGTGCENVELMGYVLRPLLVYTRGFRRGRGTGISPHKPSIRGLDEERALPILA